VEEGQYPVVRLLPLDDAEYREFAEIQVVEHADQEQRAGFWSKEEALARSREESADLLADRLRARGHRFFKALGPGGGRVGWAWDGPPPAALGLVNHRWLYQMTVEAPLRGKGYGRAMLAALEAMLAAEGVDNLRLNVYAWNTIALSLYRSAGYEVVYDGEKEKNMVKRLRASPSHA
jgi:ribosomal protein S18 acetylase RimI-like enzyme